MGTKKNLLLILFTFLITSMYSQLYVKEVMLTNKPFIVDSIGEYDERIEISNESNNPINIAGYHLSNNSLDATQYDISNTTLNTVPANKILNFLVNNDEEQEVNNTPIKLSASGGSIHLYDTDGLSVEKKITFNQKKVDLSNMLQGIVDRPCFLAGNSIVLIMEGTGTFTHKYFDGSSALTPKLWITYASENCHVKAKVLLEGYYYPEIQEMHTKLQDKGLLPMLQPFNKAPWNYTGTESTTTFPSTAVDWVLLMSRNTDGTIINQAAGFIDKSGNLLSVDGMEGIPVAGVENQYFSIHTRSHLAILSANRYIGNLYDFTSTSTQAQGIDQLKLVAGKYLLYAGDYDGSGIINNLDYNKWKIQSAKLNEYLSIDGDGNGIINAVDYNLWINNRSKIGELWIRNQ